MKKVILRALKWLAKILVSYLLLLLFLLLVAAVFMAAFKAVPTAPEHGAILVLDLGFELTEQPVGSDPAQMLRRALAGDWLRSASLRAVLEALQTARDDPAIGGLLVRGNLFPGSSAASFAALRELRGAIAAFGESKPVWAYLEMDTLRDLYVKSVATEVLGNPHAAVDFRGLYAERLYMGDALARLGIGVQVEAFAEYKTAAEAYVRGTMSAAEREQLEALLADLWAAILGDIAAARGRDPAGLDAVATRELLLYGEELTATGLADALKADDELVDYLAGFAGRDKEDRSFRQYPFLDYIDWLARPTFAAKERRPQDTVGIVHVDGVVVEGGDGDGVIGADRLIGYLREMRLDESVKAVVLRINSPGGSATAGLKVLREIELTRAAKPVVVSMGGVAASGGYMLAIGGGEVFAEPTTITGSIGTVIMLPNVAGLADRLSVRFEGVGTHPYAGSFSPGRAKTDDEMLQIRELAGRLYDDFVERVARGRNMTIEEAQRLARGRVWSGQAALANGLVDAHGGLRDAVRRAAELAGIGDDYAVTEMPERLTLGQRIAQRLAGALGPRMAAREGPLRALWRRAAQEAGRLAAVDDPSGIYFLPPHTLHINH